MHALDDEQLKALIGACKGPDLRDRRDEAIVRPMIETGVRAGEVTALQLADVNLVAGTVVVTRGKGGKGPDSADRPALRARAGPLPAGPAQPGKTTGL